VDRGGQEFFPRRRQGVNGRTGSIPAERVVRGSGTGWASGRGGERAVGCGPELAW
jgi:hypothetical protein